jgi:hypothetical protein
MGREAKPKLAISLRDITPDQNVGVSLLQPFAPLLFRLSDGVADLARLQLQGLGIDFDMHTGVLTRAAKLRVEALPDVVLLAVPRVVIFELSDEDGEMRARTDRRSADAPSGQPPAF